MHCTNDSTYLLLVHAGFVHHFVTPDHLDHHLPWTCTQRIVLHVSRPYNSAKDSFSSQAVHLPTEPEDKRELLARENVKGRRRRRRSTVHSQSRLLEHMFDEEPTPMQSIPGSGQLSARLL